MTAVTKKYEKLPNFICKNIKENRTISKVLLKRAVDSFIERYTVLYSLCMFRDFPFKRKAPSTSEDLLERSVALYFVSVRTW